MIRLPLYPQVTFDQAAESVSDAYEHADRAFQARIQTAKKNQASIPCARGCIECCHNPALVPSLEIPGLVTGLRKLSKAVQNQVWIKILRWKRSLKTAGLKIKNGVEVGAYMQARLPCPLLAEDNSCLIYEARPLACRLHNAVAADGRDCNDPHANRRWVDMTGIAEIEYQTLLQQFQTSKMTVDLLPEMVRLAWPLVQNINLNFAQWHRQLLESHQSPYLDFKKNKLPIEPTVILQKNK